MRTSETDKTEISLSQNIHVCKNPFTLARVILEYSWSSLESVYTGIFPSYPRSLEVSKIAFTLASLENPK